MPANPPSTACAAAGQAGRIARGIAGFEAYIKRQPSPEAKPGDAYVCPGSRSKVKKIKQDNCFIPLAQFDYGPKGLLYEWKAAKKRAFHNVKIYDIILESLKSAQ